MATVNFSVPSDVKEAFDKVFARQIQERRVDGIDAPGCG